jgi:hypothetical protein
MDTEYLVKQHNKITQQFRHDIIMRKFKEREDRLYRNMFIKLLLVIVIAVLLITLITR